MKKTLMSTTLIALTLAACSDQAEEAETVTVTETASEESTDPAPSEEPSEEPSETTPDEPVDPAEPSLPDHIQVTTAEFVTTYEFTDSGASVTLSDGAGTELALGEIPLRDEASLAATYAEAEASGCDLSAITYAPWADEDACSNDFVMALHEATADTPAANPLGTSLTYEQDTPNPELNKILAVDGLWITDGGDLREITGPDSARYLLAVATLIHSEPSGELCDTAAGASISIDTENANVYRGEFGMCDLDVPDYQSFTTITDILGLR